MSDPVDGGRLVAALPSAAAPLLARCAFPERPLVCAVSGGADSLALLLLAVAAGRTVTAVHVDHGLRPGSSSEASLVAQVATAVGASFASRRVEVAPGPDLEARARAARYSVLPIDVCTGHTADDLAETVVLHLLRGSGPDGVASMARQRIDGPVRPLLALRRAETVALCAAVGLTPLDDPMNHDPRFRRVRVRGEVLPLLDAIAQRDVAALLARHAQLTADDVAVLDALAEEIDPSDARALAVAPVALARRAIRRWLTDTGVGDGYVVDAASVDRVLAVARGESVATEVAGAWRVERSQQRLRVTPPAP